MSWLNDPSDKIWTGEQDRRFVPRGIRFINHRPGPRRRRHTFLSSTSTVRTSYVPDRRVCCLLFFQMRPGQSPVVLVGYVHPSPGRPQVHSSRSPRLRSGAFPWRLVRSVTDNINIRPIMGGSEDRRTVFRSACQASDPIFGVTRWAGRDSLLL